VSFIEKRGSVEIVVPPEKWSKNYPEDYPAVFVGILEKLSEKVSKEPPAKSMVAF